MRINNKVIIIAILIGLLTVFSLSNYLNKVDTRVASNLPKIEYSQVVVAANNISENTKINQESVVLKSIPKEAVHPEAITNVEEVIGGIAKIDLVAGEQVLVTKVITDLEKADLAYRIPEDMRAMSVPTNEIMGVAGHIKEGDSIDIVVTYKNINNNENLEEEEEGTTTTYTQFQNLKVLAVGSSVMTEEEKKSTLSGTITLLVTPQQGEVLGYALLNGNMHFTLRNPMDSEKVDLEHYNSTNFEGYKER